MTKRAHGNESEHDSAHAERQRKKLLTRAYMELKHGNYKMAKSLASFVCETYADADGYMILAASAQKLGEHPLSAKAYDMALAQRPDDLNLNLAYGELCLQVGQVEKARGLLTHCLERDPQARHPAAAKARELIQQCVAAV